MKRIEKETRREIIERNVIWEAADGTTFGDEQLCRKYEESYVCSIKTCFFKVPHYETNAEALFFPGESEETYAYIMKPRNINDIHAINAVLNYVNKMDPNLVTQDDIDKVIMIDFGYEGIESNGWYWLKRKDEFIKEIETALNNMEEKIGEK